MSKKYVLKYALEEHGISVSSKDIDILVRGFNNYEHPIGIRTSMIINNKEEFKEFLKYVKTELKPKPDKRSRGFWHTLKNIFK